MTGDFEVIQADELAPLRWVRENQEAVEALLAKKAAVVSLEAHGGARLCRDAIATYRLDIPASQEEP